MANWMYTLDIKDEYKEAKAGTLTPCEMAQRIAAKIEGTLPNAYDLEEIIDGFKAISESDTFDDTDVVMEMLYDWGDQWLTPIFKTCWIAHSNQSNHQTTGAAKADAQRREMNTYTDKFDYNGKTYTARYETEPYQRYTPDGNVTDEREVFAIRDADGEKMPKADVWGWELRRKLSDVQTGDKVIFVEHVRGRRSHRYEEPTVERATKTQLYVNGIRFMRTTGKKYGSRESFYDHHSITGYDELYMVRMVATMRRSDAEHRLNDRRRDLGKALVEAIKTADMATLNKLAEVLQEMEEPTQ